MTGQQFFSLLPSAKQQLCWLGHILRKQPDELILQGHETKGVYHYFPSVKLLGKATGMLAELTLEEIHPFYLRDWKKMILIAKKKKERKKRKEKEKI